MLKVEKKLTSCQKLNDSERMSIFFGFFANYQSLQSLSLTNSFSFICLLSHSLSNYMSLLYFSLSRWLCLSIFLSVCLSVTLLFFRQLLQTRDRSSILNSDRNPISIATEKPKTEIVILCQIFISRKCLIFLYLQYFTFDICKPSTTYLFCHHRRQFHGCL